MGVSMVAALPANSGVQMINGTRKTESNLC
jgi:hypothetical protein